MRVLVTRPAEDAGRTGEALAAAGHEPVIVPLFAIAPLDHALPVEGDAMVATSANALRHASLANVPRDRPLYTVGSATAEEARRAGFQDVRSADGDSRDLATMLARGSGRRLIYLAGRPRRDAALLALGDAFEVQVIETYETRALPRLPSQIASALEEGGIDAVLHFSPRAAAVFQQLASEAGLLAEAGRALHIFISAAAAVDAFQRRKIAERPNLAAMIAALSPASPVRP